MWGPGAQTGESVVHSHLKSGHSPLGTPAAASSLVPSLPNSLVPVLLFVKHTPSYTQAPGHWLYWLHPHPHTDLGLD